MKGDQEVALTKSKIIVKHPVDIKEVFIQKEMSDGALVAGGTLLQLHWETGNPLPKSLINLSSLNQLKKIGCFEYDGCSKISIGALTTIAECMTHPLLVKHAPILVKACRNIAAPAVRNRATIGGNVASQLGDTIPALLALNAEVKLAVQDDVRVMLLSEWLMKKNLPSFLLLEIIIPCFIEGTKSFYQKVGRREAFIPSLVTISAHWKEEIEGKLHYIRIAVGGGNHRPDRLRGVEQLLLEGIKKREVLYRKILEEFHSYSDPFITETYRKKVAANILLTEFSSFLREEG